LAYCQNLKNGYYIPVIAISFTFLTLLSACYALLQLRLLFGPCRPSIQ